MNYEQEMQPDVPMPGKQRYSQPQAEEVNPMSNKRVYAKHPLSVAPSPHAMVPAPIPTPAARKDGSLSTEPEGGDLRGNELFGVQMLGNARVLDVPRHQTRRHYRRVGYSNNANVLQYDKDPSKTAGLPYKAPGYNIINGMGANPRSVLGTAAQLSQLPEFLRKKYEGAYSFEAPQPILETGYYQNRYASKVSGPIY